MAVALAFAVSGLFLTVDLAFFGANALKIAHGGWLPLVIGALLFTLMTTWKRGRQIVAQRLTARAVPLEDFMARVADSRPVRVPGTAVFMTAQPRGTPPALAHNLRFNKVLHEHVVTLMVTTLPVLTCRATGESRCARSATASSTWWYTTASCRSPNIPEALALARECGLELNDQDVIYFLGRETLIVSPAPGMAMWRERFFFFFFFFFLCLHVTYCYASPEHRFRFSKCWPASTPRLAPCSGVVPVRTTTEFRLARAPFELLKAPDFAVARELLES